MTDTSKQSTITSMEDLIDNIRHSDSMSAGNTDNVGTSYSGSPGVEEALTRLKTLQIIKDTKKTAERISKFNDAFANPAAKTGWGEDNLINATEYPMTRLTQDWQLLTSLYRCSWIVQRVCNVIPEDALSDLFIEAPGLETEEIHKIEEEIRSTHLRESILEGLRWGRLYGGAAGIIMISNQEEDLSLPLDINNIMPGSFRGIYIVDRWAGIYPGLDLVDNERDPDFGLPEYYEVRDETGSGNYRVHHSRVLRFTGTKMPYWEQVAEQYWGTSAIEAMYDELIKRDNVAHNIANLTFKANLNVLKVENLDQMFATSSTVHQRRMYQMLSAINTIENSLGIRLINSTDDLQQLQYSFSGLPEVMDSAMMDMAGATCIPVTRLFGRSPAGMNSTGESDDRMYRQTLEQERAIHITPVLERLIPIVCHSAIGKFPAGSSFKYPSLIETSPQDKAQIIDQSLNPMERLFQANLIPGDAVLEAFRNTQEALDVTSTITDEMIEKVRGKYSNDLQAGQADPYGGAMQAAGAGEEEPQTDEEGNPVQPEVDENGNPIQQEGEEEGQSEEELNAAKAQYEGITKAVPNDVSRSMVLETANIQNVSPKELRQSLREREHNLKIRNKRKKELAKVIKEFPAEVAQDLVNELAATNGVDPGEFEQQIIATNNEMHPDKQIPMEEGQEQEQSQEGQEQEQPEEGAQPQQDSMYGDEFGHRSVRHGRKVSSKHHDDYLDDYLDSDYHMERIPRKRHTRKDW